MTMRRVAVHVVAWCAAIVTFAAAGASWIATTHIDHAPARLASLAAPDTNVLHPAEEGTLASLSARNPFRTARVPTQVRFGTEPLPDPSPVNENLTALGSLRVGGIVGGPPWAVLLEGIPGHESGLLLEQADTVNGIVFQELKGDTVILAAFDTILRLVPTSRWR